MDERHESRNRLITANDQVAVRAARRWRQRGARVGVDVDELIQDARLSLVLAARSFCPSAHDGGAQTFAGYARRWVHESLRRLIVRAGVVAAPRSGNITAVHIEIDDGSTSRCAGVHSMQGTVGQETLATRMSRPAGDATASHDIGNIIAALAPESRRLVRDHYGLTDGDPRTIAQLAQGHGLSVTQVRQQLHAARAELAQFGAGPDGVAALEALTRQHGQEGRQHAPAKPDERTPVIAALRGRAGVVRRAAADLGVSVRALYRRMDRHNITVSSVATAATATPEP